MEMVGVVDSTGLAKAAAAALTWTRDIVADEAVVACFAGFVCDRVFIGSSLFVGTVRFLGGLAYLFSWILFCPPVGVCTLFIDE